MTDAGLLKELIIVLGFTFGLITTSYEDYALARRWPVGEWLSGTGKIKILGFMVLIGSVISSFVITPWWFVFITIGLGFSIGFTLSNILKSGVQFIAIIGSIACFIAAPIFLW